MYLTYVPFVTGPHARALFCLHCLRTGAGSLPPRAPVRPRGPIPKRGGGILCDTERNRQQLWVFERSPLGRRHRRVLKKELNKRCTMPPFCPGPVCLLRVPFLFPGIFAFALFLRAGMRSIFRRSCHENRAAMPFYKTLKYPW